MKTTIKTHLVSKVLLRQFTNQGGQLTVFNKLDGIVRLVSPGDIAFVEVDREIIETLEQKWSNEIETHAPKTLNALYHGDALRSEKHVRMLKKILALHYVRSVVLIFLHARSREIYGQQIISEMTLAHPAHEAAIVDKVKREWPRLANETLPIILSENIEKVEEFIFRHGLEVGVAPEGCSFVLGDSPAITIGENGRMGVLRGVPITESTGFAMPITPHHLVALKTEPKTTGYQKLTVDQVENVNGKQKQHALFEYYILPT